MTIVLPVVPNVLRVSFKFRSDVPIGGTRIHFHYPGAAPNDGQCASLATYASQTWALAFANLLVTGHSLSEVIVQDLSSKTGGVGIDQTTQAGTRTGTAGPYNLAVLFSHKVARQYRGGRPRSYLPLGDEADSGVSLWNSAFISSAQTQWDLFISTMLAYGGPPSLDYFANVSYFHGFHVSIDPESGRADNISDLRTGGPQVDKIISTTAKAKISSQKRRLALES